MIKKSSLLAAAGRYARENAGGSTLEWNPQQLGVSVVRGMWVPYAYPDTVTESTGDVTQIDDLSGNGFHMVNGTNSPNWNPGTNEVEFDASNPGEYMVASMDASTQDDGYVIWVAEFLGGDTFGRYFTGPGQDNNSTGVTLFAQNSGSDFRTLSEGNVLMTTAYPSGQFLGGVEMQDSANKTYLNGVVSQTDSTSGLSMDFTEFKIGEGFSAGVNASLNLRGVIIIQGTLTTDERQRIEGWLAYKCGLQSELDAGHPYKNTTFTDPPAGFDELAYFDAGADFSSQGDFVTDVVGDTWFVSVPNRITANAGSASGNELYSNNTSNHGSGEGWKVVADGIQVLTSEVSIKVRMYDGSTESGLNHNNDEDYLFVHVVTWQGGPNDQTCKRTGFSDKWEGGPKWKHEDLYNTLSDGTGTPGTSNAPVFNMSPVNGDIIFLAKYRDSANQRYCQWIGKIQAGATGAADLNVNDTITQSTSDGQVLYLDTNNALKRDSNSTIEFKYNEMTVLRHFWYRKFATTGDFSSVDAAMKDFFDKLVTELT